MYYVCGCKVTKRAESRKGHRLVGTPMNNRHSLCRPRLAVSQLEMHSNLELSRSASLDSKPVQNTPDSVVLQDTPTPSTMDQFGQLARFDLKMQCVKDHLDSVLVRNRLFQQRSESKCLDILDRNHCSRLLTVSVTSPTFMPYVGTISKDSSRWSRL